MNIQNSQQQKWYVIGSVSKGGYSHHDPINVLTKLIESSLYDYYVAYIVVTGDISVTRTIAAAGDIFLQRKQPITTATQVVFKDSRTEIDGTFVDYADFINNAIPMYNLSEYSDNYSDISRRLWGF